MEIYRYWTVPRQTQRITTPSFAEKWRLQYNHWRKRSQLAGVVEVASRSVVLAPLQLAFLRKCDDQRLGPRDRPFSCLQDLFTDGRDSSDYFFSTCLDKICWDVVNFRWLPFFSMFALQPPLLCKRWGGRPLCLSGDSLVLMDLRWSCDC